MRVIIRSVAPTAPIKAKAVGVAALDPIEAHANGTVSRGVKEAYIEEDNGHLFFVLTDNSTVDLGRVIGRDGGNVTELILDGTDADGNYEYTMVFDDGRTAAFLAPHGPQGIQGETGPAGHTPTDDELNALITPIVQAQLGVIENGTY